MYKPFIFVLSFLLANVLCQGQDIKSLREEKAANEDAIKYTNALLDQTSVKKKQSLHQLSIISRRIELRNNLIRNISEEIDNLTWQIENNQDTIQYLTSNLSRLKAGYADLLQRLYKHRDEHRLVMFVLSSKNFNQAYKRVKYFQQYNVYQKERKAEILATANQLAKQNSKLHALIGQKENLLGDKEKEKYRLNHEKEEQQQLLGNLKNKEKELQKELAQKKKNARKLQEAIEKYLKEELARKEKGAEYYVLTPAEKIISENFSHNRGGLPWPTRHGIITENFGEHSHPVLKGVKIQNSGIDITTIKNSEVYAIFEGTVKRVVSIPGLHRTVIIRHGSYLSVYSNLLEVYVEAGEKVQTKQKIGVVYNDPAENRAILHMEIWRENEKLNPTQWISNRK